jgi:hypothetical protein
MAYQAAAIAVAGRDRSPLAPIQPFAMLVVAP